MRVRVFYAYWVLFVESFGLALTLPLLPVLLLHDKTGAILGSHLQLSHHLLLMGLLIAYPLGQLAGAPLLGLFSDRVRPRERTLVLTTGGLCMGYALTGLALYMHTYTGILLARLVTGCFAANQPIALALLTEATPERSQRTRAFAWAAGILGLSWFSALTLGMQVLGPLAAHPSGGVLVFSAPALVLLLTALGIYRRIHTSAPEAPLARVHLPRRPVHALLEVFENKTLKVLYITLFFWFLGFFLSLQWTPSIAVAKFRLSTQETFGFLFVLGSIWSLFGALFARWFSERFSLWKTQIWTLFFITLLYFFSGVSRFFLYFSICYLLSSGLIAMTWVNHFCLFSFNLDKEHYGKGFGMGQGLIALSQLLSPIVGGLLAGFAFNTLFYAAALSMLISFLTLLVFIIRRKRRPARII